MHAPSWMAGYICLAAKATVVDASMDERIDGGRRRINGNRQKPAMEEHQWPAMNKKATTPTKTTTMMTTMRMRMTMTTKAMVGRSSGERRDVIETTLLNPKMCFLFTLKVLCINTTTRRTTTSPSSVPFSKRKMEKLHTSAHNVRPYVCP